MLVLYIEDDPNSLRLIEKFLSKTIDKLLTAINATEGWQLALKHQPDLILLDMHLPDIAGLDLLKQLKENPVTKAIPVVGISAYGSSSVQKVFSS